MEMHTDVLLVTANVGSLFDNVGEIEGDWLREFFMTVHMHKPRFVALHFQEVGGKDYMVNMGHADNFFWTIESSSEMDDFDRVCVYVDSNFRAVDSFTALGSMYFIHKSLKNIQQYDFNVKEFKAVSGHNKYMGSLEGVTTIEKEKFPKNFWPDFKWSRKGYMRTRWLIHNQGLDLVNVHLFHDASNLIACNSSPSVYSANRKKALRYVINRISDSSYSPLPFFLFGDFNFRLDTRSLVQVLLHIETKLFAYLHQAVFRENNGKELLKYDKEISAFHDVITEEEIHFPPSYPYSEDYTKPTQYMNTRCPAWCDRILMSHSARDIIHRREEGESGVVYNTLGSNVCMGDHKPVFLFFPMKTITH
ncbi:type I inositol 1,4,5-trisphosphate 5-phosphatase-like isoform X3 [Sinocyclocheilus grahami]|uniref:type I inositol 1,4,5-trisphosphate 5-phosphatase-like isoform X3 n=1 Tax=Sinocyclocheilus grahami TaxID=75366 RepID=UPI0007ACD546|nr:PREDICTED: type I inositol 1,4,5-trisphosphate 5-phosphatase-like isoform X3 [Sinocyclocheilus grahami]